MRVNQAQRISSVKEYYFSLKLKEIAQLQANGKRIINLGIGSPDLPPPPTVIEALIKSAQDTGANKYQSYVGIPKLRKAIGYWYERKYSVSLNPDNEILPLMGSKEGIMHLSMTFLEKDDEVLIPNPAYPSYAAAAKLSGAKIISYKLNAENNWWPDFEQLERQDLGRVKMMWVNYPNMPTGAQASTALFEKLVDFARTHRILLCHDNPYSFILNKNPQSILSIPGAKECTIELNSLSKSHHMAGWRLGMMLGHADNIQSVLKFKSNMDSGMYRPIQEAAIIALKTNNDWHQAQNNIYQKRKNIATSILKHIGCKSDDQQVGMFVWGKIPQGYKDAYELSDLILQKTGVFITPGGIFGTAGDAYLRLSLCSSELLLTEALALIKSLNF